MTKSRPLVVALASAGAVMLAAALGLVGGVVSHGLRLVPVSDDVSVGSWAATVPSAVSAQTRLAAGGITGGAAISYLKFHVDLPDGVPPRHAEIWVARDSGKLPPMVELSAVPWADWQQRGITAATAPRLGQVVSSVFPTGYEAALHFDVSDVIREAGEYAFALTAPTSDSVGLFVSQEGISGRLPTLTLQWQETPATASSAAAYQKKLPTRTGLGRQMELFPRVKALVYFETPSNQVGMDSRVHVTPSGLAAYRDLGKLPVFQVKPIVDRPGAVRGARGRAARSIRR